MITVREARDGDAPSIREIFRSTYGDEYAYPQYYDEDFLKKLIFSDDTLVLVAVDGEEGVVGTASVVFESGAYTDLVGEFGRLAVHPGAWGRGIGALLLAERIERIGDRLHVGFMEARVAHPYSLTNGLDHGFTPAGLLPLKVRFGPRRESTMLLVRWFGDALALRRNHPRIIPEAYQLAAEVMRQAGIEPDFTVDEKAAAYPPGGEYPIQELTAKGYLSLLRIERGRLRRREVFGPLRLHYGVFKLRAERSTYLIARRGDQIVGAVGYTHEPEERILRIFELIHVEEDAIRQLLEEVERRGCEGGGTCYIEIDVSAHAPRMQRTLIELGFLPVAYVPALAFHRVERLDLLKMARLLVPLERESLSLVPPAREVAELVLRGFERREVLPRLNLVSARVGLFAGLAEDQLHRLAAVLRPVEFGTGETVFVQGERCDETFLVLDGEVAIELEGRAEPVGRVGGGECLGEVALLTGTPHSATARVVRPLSAARLSRTALVELVRRRPDIGVVLYRNLARGLGEKLRRTDRELLSLPAPATAPGDGA